MTSFLSVCQRILDTRKTPACDPALVCGDRMLNYDELILRADRLAGYLSTLGVLPGSTVAICMDRSIDWVVAALAVLRSGSAYVPLDPAWPEARVRFAVEDSGAVALFAPASLLGRLGTTVHGIDPARDEAKIAAAPSLEPLAIEPESLAYIIYTSGSTGTPKGVEITHANLCHLIDWHIEAFKLTKNDRTSHLAGLGFDAAVWEIWPTLAAGATLCIPGDTVRFSPELVQEWLVKTQISVAFAPTVYASKLIGMKWPANTRLRTLLTGGDRLPHPPAPHLPFTLVNNYGPTEGTVVATSGVISSESNGTPVIGKAIAGAHVYLLDEDGHPVEDGQTGEIYIGGGGVGRGYRNLPDTTRKSFLPDPFSHVPGARMYRSGDRGLRRADGNIEFHGRSDRQVKIRGQRIELDEISNRLNQYPAVQFAIVMANELTGEKAGLTSYVLFREDSAPTTASDLQEYLLKDLPNYMVPETFFRLKELPLSPNGKIDLALLPKAVAAPLPGRALVKSVGRPVQESLLSSARELLKNPSFGPTENFFLAGGHSLLSMQLIMRVREAYSVDVSLRVLFEAPTVEQLSHVIERKLVQARLTKVWKEILKVDAVVSDTDFLALGGDDLLLDQLQMRIASEFGRYVGRADLIEHHTFSAQVEWVSSAVQEKSSPTPGVFTVHSDGRRSPVFWLHYPCPYLAEALGEDQPFVCVTMPDEDVKTLSSEPTLEEIARSFLPRILASQRSGPYVLGGFCLGGLLSYEVACQLKAAGHEVSLLILLDTPSPDFCRRAEFGTLVTRPVYITKRIRQLGLRMTLVNVMERASKKMRGNAAPAVPPSQGEKLQQTMELAANRYKPRGYDGNVALIMATDMPPGWGSEKQFVPRWRALIPKTLHTHLVKGLHEDLVGGSAVHKVAEVISSHLQPAEAVLDLTQSQSLAR